MARPGAAQLVAWRAFLQAHAAVTDVLARELDEACGLSLTWYDILVTLADSPERRLRMHDLARSVVLSRSGVTRVVDRMEAAGLVRREGSPADRRGRFATMTPAGLAALRRAAPVHLRGVASHFTDQLSDDEVRTIGAALSRVAEVNRAKGDGWS